MTRQLSHPSHHEYTLRSRLLQTERNHISEASFTEKTISTMKMTTRTFALALCIIVASLMGTSDAWSTTSTTSSSKVSRRNFVEGMVAGAVGVAVLAPGVANADITNKVASPAALRKLKRAQKQLDGTLLGLCQANDYTGTKGFFRQPPFDDVRKQAKVLVLGGEDGPKSEELETAYKSFVSSMEKIDGTASLGMRGRKIDEFQLSQEFEVMKTSMEKFITVAEASAEIPVQYAD